MSQVDDRRAMALSAAGIYSGAALTGLTEQLLPGGQELSVVPMFAALALAAVVALFGRHLPRRVLTVFGPLGVVLVAFALATTVGYGDGAVLYMWPVLWTAYFFGRRGAVGIVAFVGIAHAVALLNMPAGTASFDRWFDVFISVIVVAAVVQGLAARNERLVDHLVAEARVDALTGLLNRRGFEERLTLETARATRHEGVLGVALFDLDHFKAINDAHGHDAGDQVLRWFAALLSEQARGIDAVARFGGEEFVVLLPRADLDAALAFAERVRTAVLDGRAASGVAATVALTVSGGVTSARLPGGVDGLVAAADRALYEAKHAGRNRTAQVA
jgi:diguanylate cyclase (GGDEF)-like protein